MSNFDLNLNTPISVWLKYISSLHSKIDLTLDRIKIVAKRLKIINKNYRPFIITIGGTNGKGTTSRLIELILINSGKKVGVYSSPHLIKYEERARIQGKNVSSKLHVKAMYEVEKKRGDIPLTYFEFSTLSIIYIFYSIKLDVLILEIGMGGMFDAVNIIENDISVITSVSYDHTSYLGNSIEDIALEKSGIFRYKKDAVIGEKFNISQLYYMSNFIKSYIYAINKNWSISIFKNFWLWKNNKYILEMPIPNIPIQNAATALAVIHRLPFFNISYKNIFNCVKQANLPGRFQIINKKPIIVLDVAHNPQSSLYLSKKIKNLNISGNIYVIIGMLKDKDIFNTIKYFKKYVEIKLWICISLKNKRGANSKYISSNFVESEKYENFSKILKAWKKLKKILNKEDCVVIFGSFKTVSLFFSKIFYKKFSI
ncbi:MAG: bifunctional tetrahydrofolate synthase/dihydrofolate synthase [Enterobacteriaceae bacterium]